ncbi:MAG: hypothetical protein K1X72_03740 [Pyrinomonadaceae bacterium]|nr:hypothetical protein [Pyrinomonadaceae bacterium]
MRKLLNLLILTFVLLQVSFAQKGLDKAITDKAADLFLEADKTLLEPGESAKLSIIAVLRNDPNDENPNGKPYSETVLPPNNSIYKASNWRIVQGGGNLFGVDETTQTFTAPAKFSTEKYALISVELAPLRPNLPKITLLQTIYFSENETSFVLNMPAIGIINSKYISKLDKGATMPKIVDVPKNIPPEIRAKLEAAQKENKANPIDLNAISSNAVAIYDKDQDFTAIRFSELGAQMRDGKINQTIEKEAVLAFNFNGKEVGNYQIGEEKTGLGFFVTQAQQGFGCGDTQSDTEKYPCSGTIKITQVDPKFIKGTVRVTVFTSVEDKIFRGNFYGKFKVKRAN